MTKEVLFLNLQFIKNMLLFNCTSVCAKKITELGICKTSVKLKYNVINLKFKQHN